MVGFFLAHAVLFPEGQPASEDFSPLVVPLVVKASNVFH